MHNFQAINAFPGNPSTQDVKMGKHFVIMMETRFFKKYLTLTLEVDAVLAEDER